VNVISDEIAAVFAQAGAQGFPHAGEVTAGRLDETDRTQVTAHHRIGGIGTAGCADDVEMSRRDRALFMLTMSDNAATDVVYHRGGRAVVDRVLNDLGLSRTHFRGCCEDLFASLLSDLDTGEGNDVEAATGMPGPRALVPDPA
jgi:beta-lactamase class A